MFMLTYLKNAMCSLDILKPEYVDTTTSELKWDAFFLPFDNFAVGKLNCYQPLESSTISILSSFNCFED